MLLFSASLSTFKLTLPLFLQEYYNFSLADIYLTMTISYLLANIVFKPVFGLLADYIGKKQLIIASSLVMLVGGLPMFSLLNYGTTSALFTFIIFSQIITSSIVVSCFSLLPKAFPTSIRYTGVGFSYNVAQLIAAFTPLIATYLCGVLKHHNYLAVIFMFLALVTICSTILFKPIEE